jgi:hypothetical protein
MAKIENLKFMGSFFQVTKDFSVPKHNFTNQVHKLFRSCFMAEKSRNRDFLSQNLIAFLAGTKIETLQKRGLLLVH